MTSPLNRFDAGNFIKILYEKMQAVSPCISKLELYEFRYCLKEWEPEGGWESVTPDDMDKIEACLGDRLYYDRIQVAPRVEGRIVMDSEVTRMTRMLFLGIFMGLYSPEWVVQHFYFDLRGFFFLPRTTYFTDVIRAHFGGNPYRTFEQKQKLLEDRFELGYQEFKEANREIDGLFLESLMKLISAKGTPIVLALAGATAAGKTEIVERLGEAFTLSGRQVTSMELDNFLTDREYREAIGIDSQGKAALHLELLRQCLEDLAQALTGLTPEPATASPVPTKLPPADYWDEDTVVDFQQSRHKIDSRLGSGGIGQTFTVTQHPMLPAVFGAGLVTAGVGDLDAATWIGDTTSLQLAAAG